MSKESKAANSDIPVGKLAFKLTLEKLDQTLNSFGLQNRFLLNPSWSGQTFVPALYKNNYLTQSRWRRWIFPPPPPPPISTKLQWLALHVGNRKEKKLEARLRMICPLFTSFLIANPTLFSVFQGRLSLRNACNDCLKGEWTKPI